jgi:transcriptional regulator with XRE-family HTH domain
LPFSTLDKSISRLPKQYKQTPETIGQHLLKVRIDRNLTKKAVAAQIGVSSSTIGTWEQDKGKPEATHMKGVISFLGYYPLPEPTTLAGRILKYRHVHGLTLEEFGKLLSADGATVWTWENAVYTPFDETIRKIEELINLKELSQ